MTKQQEKTASVKLTALVAAMVALGRVDKKQSKSEMAADCATAHAQGVKLGALRPQSEPKVSWNKDKLSDWAKRTKRAIKTWCSKRDVVACEHCNALDHLSKNCPDRKAAEQVAEAQAPKKARAPKPGTAAAVRDAATLDGVKPSKGLWLVRPEQQRDGKTLEARIYGQIARVTQSGVVYLSHEAPGAEICITPARLSSDGVSRKYLTSAEVETFTVAAVLKPGIEAVLEPRPLPSGNTPNFLKNELLNTIEVEGGCVALSSLNKDARKLAKAMVDSGELAMFIDKRKRFYRLPVVDAEAVAAVVLPERKPAGLDLHTDNGERDEHDLCFDFFGCTQSTDEQRQEAAATIAASNVSKLQAENDRLRAELAKLKGEIVSSKRKLNVTPKTTEGRNVLKATDIVESVMYFREGSTRNRIANLIAQTCAANEGEFCIMGDLLAPVAEMGITSPRHQSQHTLYAMLKNNWLVRIPVKGLGSTKNGYMLNKEIVREELAAF